MLLEKNILILFAKLIDSCICRRGDHMPPFQHTSLGTPAPEMIINTFKDGVKGLAFPKAHTDVRGESRAKIVFEPVSKEDEGWYR